MAIGTHDLGTLRPPFTYEALPPEAITFVPLKQTRTFRADELLAVRPCQPTTPFSERLSPLSLALGCASCLRGCRLSVHMHASARVPASAPVCSELQPMDIFCTVIVLEMALHLLCLSAILRTRVCCGGEVQFYSENDKKLRRYVPIIQDSLVFPVVLDANRTVMSMPPVINSAHSAVRYQARLRIQFAPLR